MIAGIYLFSIVLLGIVGAEGAMEAKIRCDDTATVIYIDETRVGSTNEWDEVWARDIGGKSRLIAVRCYNSRYSGGLIASFANGLVSDETWKCRHYTDNDNWYRLDTDDSISPWYSAYVIPPSLAPSSWSTSGTFPDNAKWIWKDSSFKSESISSLCRAELGISTYVKFNNRGRVYADGVVMSSIIRNAKTKILIPRTTHVVAIEAYNWKNNAYIQAIFPNGYRTDTSWRCTDRSDIDWNLKDYDDSLWNHATDYGPGDIGAGDDVRKIWTADIVDDSYIYCRGHFECGCEYICKEHDNEYDFRCLCPEGFILAKNGLSCDKDACGIQNAGCEDVCVNTDQSYKCECSVPGYEVDTDMHSCININECERDMHNCSQTCVDTKGAFRCECFKGFTLQQDKVSCHDTNECDENNGDCDQLCLNTNGSYACDCTRGYELSIDSRSCSNINECDRETHNCTYTMLCQDTEGGFNCFCLGGYKMQRDMETCQDIDECSAQNQPCNHTCINTAGSYMCNCSEGYSLDADGHTCLLDGDNEMSGPSIGMIAGIAVALVAITLVAILVLILLKRRRKPRKSQKNTALGHLQHFPLDSPKAEDTSGSPKDLPLVYYNVGREMPEPVETPYEEVDRVRFQKEGITIAGINSTVLPTVPPPTLILQQKSDSQTTTPSQPLSTNKLPESPVPLLNVSANISTTRQQHGPEMPIDKFDAGSLRDLDSSDDSSDDVDVEPNVSIQTGVDNIYSNVASEDLLTKPIKVGELAEYVREMLEGERFQEEFERLPSGQRGKCQVCNRPGIRKKLRFRNIKPYDHSIVPLDGIEKEPLSDFINASFVHGYQKANFFIATQGPKPATLNDFWRMIWQHNVGTITMLTSCFESGNEKCSQYWPDHSVKTYGDISVKTVDKLISADFTVRTFMVKKGNEKRSVKHFHYTTWPDQSVPDDGTSLIALRRKIKEAEKSMGPVVVHCSAGVGRTGTYIALDYLMEQAESEGVVDVCGCVNLMRENRMNMIQSSLQYQFVHTTLLEAILVGHTSVPCSEFPKRLVMLKKTHPQTKKTGIQIQFKLLETLKLPQENFSFKAARLPENQVKNRDPTIGPADNQYLHLHPTEWTKDDYINAVFVDGYRTRQEFIVTQMPLSNTKYDLWRLVDDYKVSTIVMLNEAGDNSEEIYFPSSDKSLAIGPLIIELKGTDTVDSFIRRNLTVQTNSRTISVTHINVTNWSDSLKDGTPTLLALFKEVQKLKQKQAATGPVLIHCLDGVERCGLFCAAYLMLDKINAESEVDVFNAVKKIRADRPQFVVSEEQYRFLHDVAQEYIDSFDLYANFK